MNNGQKFLTPKELMESQCLFVPFAQNSVLSSLLSITLGFKIFKLRFLAYSNIFCVRQGM